MHGACGHSNQNGSMGDPVQAIMNNEEWRQEKLDFICSVVSNVDQQSLLSELSYCETDEDAEGLMQSLILVQDERFSQQQNDAPRCQQRLNEHIPPQNDIIVRLPEEQDGESVILQPEDQYREGHDNEDAESEEHPEVSDSEDSCYFTPDIFNSSQTEHPEGDERGVNNVEVENVESEENDFAAEIAQAIAESSDMTGAVAQAKSGRNEVDNKIMNQIAIISDLFSNADPDFLQERIDKCMQLGGDEEAFHLLYEECLDLKNYPTMKDYVKRKKQAQEADSEDVEESFFVVEKDAQVVADNLTVECGICFEENTLGIDTNTCSALKNEHTYCNRCIKRYVEAQIGQGLTVFKCMEGYCDAEFSLRMLQKLIEQPVFAKLWERRQQEEIAAAGVENLESCPFCNYMVSMPNEEDRIIQCWNPDCMIDSCRKCKEPSHIPLRCNEVEKKGQRNARTFLENEMAEAMIRECPRCKKRFIIEAGCNRMTCPCGAVMCYVCKQLIDTTNGDGYNHFERGPIPSEKCPLYSNATVLHEAEVRDAAERARQGLDPQVTLLRDPTEDLL